MDICYEIKDLKVGFETFEGFKRALDIKHLEIYKGETFGLVGESGAGKSVLALTSLKLLPIPPGVIESGEILLNGENILNKNEKQIREIRGKKISMIFQDPMSSLNPVFTVGEQIVRVIVNNQKVSRREAEKKAVEMINMVKLPDAKNIMRKYPHELSGGQRQRVIIAVALSCGAEFLIADEPTRNLDVTIQAGILKLIYELKKELKMTTLFIANNMSLVSAICDRIGILHEGRIVEIGSVHEVVQNPKHPYTQILRNAIPRNPSVLNRIMVKEDLEEGIEGCGYYKRCPHRKPVCKNNLPEMQLVEGTHYVACFKEFERGEPDE